MAKVDSAFLNQVERELMEDLCKIRPHVKERIWLYTKAYSTFERICKKAKKHPGISHYDGIDPQEMTYMGLPVVSLAKRKSYTKRNLEKMDLA